MPLVEGRVPIVVSTGIGVMTDGLRGLGYSLMSWWLRLALLYSTATSVLVPKLSCMYNIQ